MGITTLISKGKVYKMRDIPVVEACIWTLQHDYWDDYWESGCDGHITAWTPDGSGPKKWGWKVCPFCGSQIIERRPNEDHA